MFVLKATREVRLYVLYSVLYIVGTHFIET